MICLIPLDTEGMPDEPTIVISFLIGLFVVFEDVFPVFAQHVKVTINKDKWMSLEGNQR